MKQQERADKIAQLKLDQIDLLFKREIGVKGLCGTPKQQDASKVLFIAANKALWHVQAAIITLDPAANL